MKKIQRYAYICILLLCFLIVGCTGQSTQQTNDPNASYNESIKPEKGQPAFPKLGQYWVVDSDNACGFSQKTLMYADKTFETLRTDGIAEVALVCQTGIKNLGPMNDEKIWSLGWGRWARLGDKKDRRAIVFLIRPDVKPEENRITIQISDWLTWYTVPDYYPCIEQGAMYANANDFNEALASITWCTDQSLRAGWKTHQK